MPERQQQGGVTPPAIHFTKVSLSYNGEAVFDEFTATIPAGSCTCLLGPSGCG